MYINFYMKGMLSVWQANHDIQYVLDAYSCVVYICDYMTKANRGMSEILATACEEAKAGNMSLKESVRHMGNKFLNCAEISAQECCYDLLELPFTKSTVKTEFISTCKPDERVFIAKDDSLLQEMDPDSEDIKQAGNIERYAKCPKVLEHWCLADYVSELDLRYSKKNLADHGDDDEVQTDDEGVDEHEESGVFPMNLKNGRALYKHKERKVIRFVNYRYKLDPENYCRERLLLYTSWRNEETDLYHGKETYIDAFNLKQSRIHAKMAVYEPLSAVLDDAVHMLEQEAAIDHEEVAPSTQHEDMQHKEEQSVKSKSHEFYDPERPLYQRESDIGPILHLPGSAFQDSVEIIANKMSDDAYRRHLQSLNQEQMEFFTHIMTLVSDKDTQVTCCCTGGAGTGKSHVLKALYQGLYRAVCMEAGQSRDSYRILVAAPTGKSAYNVKGMTIHAAFHIPANQSLKDYKSLTYDVLNTYRMKYRQLEWLLIDEISMVSNDLFKYVHLHLQDIKHSTKPFGGVNIIVIGDLFQLQPVMGDFVFMDLQSNYGSLAINLCASTSKCTNLPQL